MALLVEKGSFSINTAVGNQTVTLANGSLTPKLVLAWLTDQTAAGYTSGNGAFAFGATDGTNMRCATFGFDDAAAAVNTNRFLSSDRLIYLTTGGVGSLDGHAQIVSFGAGQFVVNVTNNFTASFLVHYLAIGGADVTNVKVGTFATGTATGNVATTDPGFQPDCVLLAHNGNAALDVSAGGGTNQSGGLQIGMATSSSARAMTGFVDPDAQDPSEGASRQDAKVFWSTVGGAPTEDGLGDFVSMDATGFTINISNAPAQTVQCLYVAVKGGLHQVGLETQRTSTGTKDTTTTGITPKGLFATSWNRATSTSTDTALAKMSITASDGAVEGGIWHQSASGAATTDCDVRTQTTKGLAMSTQASTTDAEADVTFSSGKFTADWTTADGTAREFAYWVVGEATAAATGIPPVVMAPPRKS